ncbi:hypothetical protein B0H13DRAFT_2023627, partial [Mycena leptocephala]
TRRRIEPNGRAELRRAISSVRCWPASKDLARALAGFGVGVAFGEMQRKRGRRGIGSKCREEGVSAGLEPREREGCGAGGCEGVVGCCEAGGDALCGGEEAEEGGAGGEWWGAAMARGYARSCSARGQRETRQWHSERCEEGSVQHGQGDAQRCGWRGRALCLR